MVLRSSTGPTLLGGRATSTTARGPAPRDLVEVATTSPWCQRWRGGAHSWRHIHEGGFDARAYRVEPIDEATARAWVCRHHYTSAYPAASQRYGLHGRDGQLVGVIVLGVPMSERVLTNVFPDLCPSMHRAVGSTRLYRSWPNPSAGRCIPRPVDPLDHRVGTVTA